MLANIWLEGKGKTEREEEETQKAISSLISPH